MISLDLFTNILFCQISCSNHLVGGDFLKYLFLSAQNTFLTDILFDTLDNSGTVGTAKTKIFSIKLCQYLKLSFSKSIF